MPHSLNLQLPESKSPSPVRLGIILFSILVACRFALLILLASATHAAEFSDDIGFLVTFASSPFSLIDGSAWYPFPPLISFLMAFFAKPLLLFLPKWYAMRISFMLFEMISWPILWSLICYTTNSQRVRCFLGITYIVAPVSWMASVVMCQEETISLVFFSLIVWAILKKRPMLAVFLCGLGVVSAKVYFLIPLCVLCALLPTKPYSQTFKRAALGFLPIIIVYGCKALLSMDSTGQGLASFAPPCDNSVNIWCLLGPYLGLDGVGAKKLSAIFAATGVLMPIAIGKFLYRNQTVPAMEQVRIITASMMWCFTCFYHINAEYFLIIVPALLILFRPWISMVIVIIVMTLPWAVNFFYGINLAIERGINLAIEGGPKGGKVAFVKLYQSVSSIPPDTLLKLTVYIFSIAILAISITLTVSVVLRAKTEANTKLT